LSFQFVAELSPGTIDSEDIFKWNIRLKQVGGTEDVTTTTTQDAAIPTDLTHNLIGFTELFTGSEDCVAIQSPQLPVNNSDAPRPMMNVLAGFNNFAHGFHGQAAHPGKRIYNPNARRFPEDTRPRVAASVRKRILRSFRLECLIRTPRRITIRISRTGDKRLVR